MALPKDEILAAASELGEPLPDQESYEDLAAFIDVVDEDEGGEFVDFAETLDFATKKKKRKSPKCTAGKSHFCKTPAGRGSCVSVKKKCRYKPNGATKSAAEYVGKQGQYKDAQAWAKAGKAGNDAPTSGGGGVEPIAGGDHNHTIVGVGGITSDQLNYALNQLPEGSRELVKDFISRNDIKVALFGDRPLTRQEKQKLAPGLSRKNADQTLSPMGKDTMGRTSFFHNVVNINLEANAFSEKPSSFDTFKSIRQNSLDDIDTGAMGKAAAKELKRADNLSRRVDNGGLDYADDRASRIMYTYLHELGHQVQFAGWNKTIDLGFDAKPVSWYATSDNMELFAEAFATWAINPTAYTKYDPQGASQIESLIQQTRTRYEI